MKTFKGYLTEGDVVQGPWKKRKEEVATKHVKAPLGDKKAVYDPKHFDKWHKDNIKHDEGSSVTTTSAYHDYCNHAEEHGVEPHDFPTFSKKMSDTGIVKQRIAGAIRHIGVTLNKKDDDDGR